MKEFVTILAGGKGTRFWPVSRAHHPKQMLAIAGSHSMLQEAILRIQPQIPPQQAYVITTVALWNLVVGQLDVLELGSSWENRVLAEPQGKNTAPAVALTALYLHHLHGESVMIVLAADHYIRDQEGFLEVLKQACEGAKKGYLVTLGLPPTRPETGYGYIHPGEKLDGGPWQKVVEFVEKPDRERAQQYVDQGFWWNSGMFIWKTSRILEEVEKHAPDLHQSLKKVEPHLGKEGEQEAVEAFYEEVERTSIDYAVMEKADLVAVLPADVGWSDVGSFQALDEVCPRDDQGNILRGNVVAKDTTNTVVWGNRRLVATLGVDDLVVADTEDAVLVSRKDRSQEVRDLVEILTAQSASELVDHRTVERPWGKYTVLAEGEEFKLKMIEVKAGGVLSLQKHSRRSEHWVVVEGTAEVTLGDDILVLYPPQTVDIPVDTFHRLANRGDKPLKIVEIQSGDYFGEDDIVRVDDIYGRTEDRPFFPEERKG